MKAEMTLIPTDGGKPFTRVFDWDDELEVSGSRGDLVKAEKISLYDHEPIIDGKPCRIYKMFSYGENHEKPD